MNHHTQFYIGGRWQDPAIPAALDNAWGGRGWTRVTLAALSEAELRAALEMAWRRAAAKPPRRGAAAIRATRKKGRQPS